MPLQNSNLKYYFALTKFPNIGPVRLKKILETTDLESFFKDKDINDIQEKLENQYNYCDEILTWEEEAYPSLLKEIYDPPFLIYLKGLLRNFGKSIAIVGTRHCSDYAREVAYNFARELAASGFTIVSGLAAGVDAAAHKGVLSVNGKTIAVLGHGLDFSFPPENNKLRKEIEEKGLVITEYPVGQNPNRQTFPRRNRIIAGLSIGTIMVEGDYKSGAMITAKLALDQGREVFAVPGHINQKRSRGAHWLIKQGAKLVENIEDILEEFDLSGTISHKTVDREPLAVNLSNEEKKIYSLLSMEKKHIDEIVQKSEIPANKVFSMLTTMQLKKAIKELPGKFFSLIS